MHCRDGNICSRGLVAKTSEQVCMIRGGAMTAQSGRCGEIYRGLGNQVFHARLNIQGYACAMFCAWIPRPRAGDSVGFYISALQMRLSL